MLAETFETINLELLTLLLNDGIYYGLSGFNDYLATQWVQIPTNLFGIFELSDLTLKYHDNYIEGGATPTFLPQAARRFVPVIPRKVDKPNCFFEVSFDDKGNYNYK